MAKCIICDKRGFFLSVDKNRLCRSCAGSVYEEVESLTSLASDSMSIASGARVRATRLSRLRTAMHAYDRLAEYQSKGLNIFPESPAAVAGQIRLLIKATISEAVSEITYDARRRSADAATETTKINAYSKAVSDLDKLASATDDVTAIETAIIALRVERDNLRLDLMTRKAETEIEKGKLNRALDIYIEAAAALRHDSTPDAQQKDRSKAIQGKIVDLRARLAK